MAKSMTDEAGSQIAPILRHTPAQGMDMDLMRVLSDPNITAEKMQIVLQAKRELLADRRKEAFQTAFVAMANELPQITKLGVVVLKSKDGHLFGQYKYVRLEDMDDVIRPILSKYGFALSFSQVTDDKNMVTVRGTLMHIDGHSIESERTLPPDVGPGRNALQAIGSAVSYARRYLTEGLCNLVRRDQDDDGVGAVSKPITVDQVGKLVVLLKAVKTQPDTFLRLFVTGCERLEDIQARDFPRLENALEEKKRSMEKDK